MKRYATRKRSIPQDKYQGTIGTTLDYFGANGIVNIAKALRQNESQTETDEIEAILNAAKKIISIREETQKLNEESKEIVEKLKKIIDENKTVLEDKGLINYREGNVFLKLPGGISVSVWRNLNIPDDKLKEVVDMLREKDLDDEFVRYKVDKTYIEKELKKHSLDSNPNDRLREIYEIAMETGALEINYVVVVKKDQAEKKE